MYKSDGILVIEIFLNVIRFIIYEMFVCQYDSMSLSIGITSKVQIKVVYANFLLIVTPLRLNRITRPPTLFFLAYSFSTVTHFHLLHIIKSDYD